MEENNKKSVEQDGKDKKSIPDKRKRTRKQKGSRGSNGAKPGAAYGNPKDNPNPGDGEVFKGGQGSTGEMEGVPAAEMDARDAYKQDPAWAQTNPSEFANAFQPAFSNYDQVVTGSKFPWYLSEWQGTSEVAGQVIHVDIESTSPIDVPSQFMELDVALTAGECWHPEEYGSDYQPYVYIGKLLYQSISARKRNALPVDALSISAYLMAFQSIVALRSYIRLILKLCSIVENSEKNVAKRNARMLRCYFSTQLGMEMAIGMAGAGNTNDYWMNAVGAMNSIDGTMNQCMSPPELPIYKRADYLFSHVIAEYNDEEMSNFYLMKLQTVYKINWVGDENGTYLEPISVLNTADLHTLIDKYRALVDAFTGHAWGADDPNHIQAGLKYVFANKIHFSEWESTTYTTAEGKETVSPVRATWSDVLASGIDCHTWLHNLHLMDRRIIPGVIAYDERYLGLHQSWLCNSLNHVEDACKMRVPLAWDFEFGSPSADDLYESSTLTALYKVRPVTANNSRNSKIYFEAKNDKDYASRINAALKEIDSLTAQYKFGVDKWTGSAEDRKKNADISAQLRELRDAIEAPFDMSIGTEVVNNINVTRVDASYSIHRLPYDQSSRLITDDASDVTTWLNSMSAAAKFAHRPLQYLTYTNSLMTARSCKIVGVNYDTYALCPIRENDVDRMHFIATKSYFGISNRDTLSWITPTSAYNDLDKS